MPDPLGIRVQCPACGAEPGKGTCQLDTSLKAPCSQGAQAYIPLSKVPESVIEELRAEHLTANTLDATAEDLGPAPPGIKDPEELEPPEVHE